MSLVVGGVVGQYTRCWLRRTKAKAYAFFISDFAAVRSCKNASCVEQLLCGACRGSVARLAAPSKPTDIVPQWLVEQLIGR